MKRAEAGRYGRIQKRTPEGCAHHVLSISYGEDKPVCWWGEGRKLGVMRVGFCSGLRSRQGRDWVADVERSRAYCRCKCRCCGPTHVVPPHRDSHRAEAGCRVVSEILGLGRWRPPEGEDEGWGLRVNGHLNGTLTLTYHPSNGASKVLPKLIPAPHDLVKSESAVEVSVFRRRGSAEPTLHRRAIESTHTRRSGMVLCGRADSLKPSLVAAIERGCHRVPMLRDSEIVIG